MIPEYDPPHGYLPPGLHHTSWSEVAERFSVNSHRERLFGGLLLACRNLASAGCIEVLLNGSFVSSKLLPEDYDGAWEMEGVNVEQLDPVLLDFSNSRARMKIKYFGELFPASTEAAPGVLYREFFKTDRLGIEKGLVVLDLRSLT